MKALIKVVLTVVVLVSSFQVSAAKYFNGHQALAMCQSSSPDNSAGCAMFIVGVAETLRMVGYNGDRYCIAQSLDNRQLRHEFIAFLNANPKSLQYSATSIFYASLLKNHPCHVNKQSGSH